jgi:succinate dehydrogenase / fumarate reductase, cytochrome b subunit
LHPADRRLIGPTKPFEDLALATVKPSRPLSPHLTIWRWGPHMLVSILHRATGVAMACVGLPLLVWFLAALAAGEDSYRSFTWFFGELTGGAIGYLVGIGLTLALFIHMGNGVRHLFLDAGALFELKRNKLSSLAAIAFGVVATVLYWLYLVVVK